MEKDKYLLLDLNGVLCKRGQGKIFEFYPDIFDFLRFCFENYNVGIFSSTTYKNASVIVEKINNEMNTDMFFMKWYRDRTKFDPEYKINSEITEFDTIKNVIDVIDNPIINYKRLINKTNILILDDSIKKIRFNNKENYIVVDKPLMKLIPDIVEKFEMMK